MRVLAVGNMYPPHHLGGYELAWRSAMEHLRREGHETRVLTTDFCTATSAPDDQAVYRELRWYWHDHGWPALDWRQRIRLERHNHAVLSRHLSDLRPDAVSWWAMGGMSLSLIEHVRRAGIPSVAFVHDEWLVYGPQVDQWTRGFRRRPRVAAIAERLLGVPTRVDIDSSTTCQLVSETVRAHARQAGYRLANSAVSPSGIDTDLFRARPEPEWRWRVLYVGRIDERKGVTDAVASLAELPDQATLTLVGDGDARTLAGLGDLAERLGLGDRVKRLGMADRSELPSVYAGRDALLFPVRWEEPWGLVPLEAMAVGRPVIATGRGGSGEYLSDGANCLITRADDPAAIATAVRRLAGDPDLRARLRAGGLQTAERFTETGFNQRVASSLTALLASARPRSCDVAA